MNKVGFIGLGIMGRPMALNLVKGGVDLYVNDIDPAAVNVLTDAGAKAADLAAIGRECDIIITILPNGEIVKDVLFGANGLQLKPAAACGTAQPADSTQPTAACPTSGARRVVCDMSSVIPVDSRFCEAKLAELGIGFVDAPVSGGEPKAIDGTLAIMAGGSQSDFDALVPYFEIMGDSWTLVGDSGCGSIAKLANQAIVNMTIATVGEAFVLASKAGADPRKVYEAIRGGLAGSAVLDAKAPMMIERNFKPGGKISINQKDINNVMATAKELKVPMPLAAQLSQIMQWMDVHGNLNDDHAGLVKYFEALADCEVAAPNATKATATCDATATDDADIGKTIVVLDDDPTGTQTVHDITVFTTWETEELEKELQDEKGLFYVLTNSRAMSKETTIAVHKEIMKNLIEASKRTGRDFLVISRSDSTLRGHFPIETEIIRECLEEGTGVKVDGEFLCPFFLEGGRFTIDDIHYVKDGDQLIPAAETEFARDEVFGYTKSNLKEYIEEKTGGAYKASDVISIGLDEIRSGDVAGIEEKLMGVHDFQKVIVNAETYDDLAVFAKAFKQAVKNGKVFIGRTAASIVKVLGGVSDQPLLTKADMCPGKAETRGVVMVGSYTEKTTRQIEAARVIPQVECIEFNSHTVGCDVYFPREINKAAAKADEAMRQGKTALIYTKRERLCFDDDSKEEILARSVKISEGVKTIVEKLQERPDFIIAKGGITSSDIATKAMGIKSATVAGQIKPGVPVWKSREDNRFKDIAYVIFPGNVGNDDTLKEIIEELL